jgi:two-component system phosphate regulon sensor histidine kinase PhoR
VPQNPPKPDSGTFRLPDAIYSESGTFRAMGLPPESAALQDTVSRMFLAQDSAEIMRLLVKSAVTFTGARSGTVFLFAPDRETLGGGDPALLPESAVVDYVFQDARPATVPHGEGRFITVFPLRVGADRLGLLVLDVSGLAEEVSKLNLEPLGQLADQAAVIVQNVQTLSRSVGESTLLNNILDSITNAIVTIDTQRKVTRLNRNAMAMLEISPDALGRPYSEIFIPEVVKAVDQQLKEISHLGFSMEKMVNARLPAGIELNIALSASILRDDAYAPLGTILVFRDMTASRELDRLRKLDTMKSEFVANVSHELKTPLTSIKAYTEALLDMAQDKQMKSFLEVIDEESDRLLFLINDLLNVSRIQSGKMKMHFEPVKPRACLDEVLKISKVHSDRHRLVLDVADGLPEMLLDKEKMKEVFINLLSNAIKYSPKGGEVRVRMRLDDSNLRIEIQDQGIGIPDEHKQKLFEAFYRVDSSHTAEIPGTGLGLVICKAIVEHHGGRIWFESEFGKGTTFLILIPVRREIRRGEAGGELGSMA